MCALVTTYGYNVGANVHTKLTFDGTEGLPAGVSRSMGFKIAKTGQGYDYNAYDDASREVVDQVQRAGFPIDPQTLKIRYQKEDWSGPFGVYKQRPGENRPAFTVGIDHRFNKPLLAPRQYTAGVGSGQTALPARVSAVAEFKGTMYVAIAGRLVYKLDNWSGGVGAAYLTLVFTHSNVNAVLRDFVVYNDVLYVAAGESATYAYTTDGAAWTESTRGAPDDKAEQWRVIHGMLFKSRVPYYCYQTTNGQNGATAWSLTAVLGDSQAAITALELLAVNDNLVMAKEEGLFNIDPEGNVSDLYPELQKLREPGNGFHSTVWNNVLFYPTYRGEEFAWRDGRPMRVTPALQQERRLETSPAYLGTFIGRIRAHAGTQDYMYVEMKRESDGYHRILVLQDVGDGNYRWYTLLDLATTTSDELFVSSHATSGPVLWATTSTELGNMIAYWTLPAGPDPLQDSRYRFGTQGTLYEPWLDMGCPTTTKRWAEIEVEAMATQGTGCKIIFRVIAEDGTQTQRELTPGTAATITTLRLPKAFFAKKIRIEIEFASDNALHTPVLLAYSVIAYVLPAPVRVFEFTCEIPGSGVQGGIAEQKVARAFLNAVRSAQMPMEFTDIFGDVWCVIPFPPPPSEATTAHERGRWDEAWHVALIESQTREFELMYPPPADEEPPPGGGDGLPPGEVYPHTGWGLTKRVYLSGRTGAASPNIPKMVRTDAACASSVVWTDCSTGLPTGQVADGDVHHSLDPWDETKGVVIVRRSAANGGDILYRGTDLLGTGAWVVSFNLATLNTALGIAETDITLYQVQYTIAARDFIYLIGAGTNGNPLVFFLARSEDGGITWTVYNHSATVGGVTGNYFTSPSMTVGQWNANLVYLGYIRWANGWAIRVSKDAGATFTSKSYMGAQATRIEIALPYHQNSLELTLYRYDTGTMNTSFRRSTDEGATWLTIKESTNWPLAGVPDTRSHWLGCTGGANGMIESLDDGFTQTNVNASQIPPASNPRISLVRTGAYLYVSGKPQGITPWSSINWIAFTNLTGNLNSLIPHTAPDERQLDAITGDWRTEC